MDELVHVQRVDICTAEFEPKFVFFIDARHVNPSALQLRQWCIRASVCTDASCMLSRQSVLRYVDIKSDG